MRSTRRLLAIAVAALAAGPAAAAHADPGAGQATGFSAGFSTLRAGAPSALTLRTVGRAPEGTTTLAPAIRGQLFFAGERDGVPLRQGFWGTASGRRLTLVVSTFGGRIAPTHLEARLDRRPGGATWLRTPRRCPAPGRWRFEGRFTGLTAVSGGAPVGEEQRLRATSSCRG